LACLKLEAESAVVIYQQVLTGSLMNLVLFYIQRNVHRFTGFLKSVFSLFKNSYRGRSQHKTQQNIRAHLWAFLIIIAVILKWHEYWKILQGPL